MGGFNRMDVVKYIECLAAERNKYKSEAEALTDELSLTEQKVESLEKNAVNQEKALADLESTRLRLCEEMRSIIENTRDEYSSMKTEAEQSAAHLREELMKLCGDCEKLIALLDKSEGRLAALDINIKQS